MTIKQALKAVAGFPLEENNVDLVLINNDLNGADTYSKDHIASVEIAAANALFNAYSSPNISEGDLSINIDRPAMLAKILTLSRKHQIEAILSVLEVRSTINSRAVW